jgi:hypothetical protein
MVTPEKAITMDLETSNKSNSNSSTDYNNTSIKMASFLPIKKRWNLWAHLPQDSDWSTKSYKQIYTFTTVEETIAITESLPDPLIKNCMLFIMQEGIIPMWEDPKNRHGGCFSYKVSNKNVCDVWRELTYMLVGESVSNNVLFVNAVTGITISPKKNFCIVKIWMTSCDHQNPGIVTTDINWLVSQGCLFKKHSPEF